MDFVVLVVVGFFLILKGIGNAGNKLIYEQERKSWHASEERLKQAKHDFIAKHINHDVEVELANNEEEINRGIAIIRDEWGLSEYFQCHQAALMVILAERNLILEKSIDRLYGNPYRKDYNEFYRLYNKFLMDHGMEESMRVIHNTPNMYIDPRTNLHGMSRGFGKYWPNDGLDTPPEQRVTNSWGTPCASWLTISYDHFFRTKPIYVSSKWEDSDEIYTF